MKRSAVVALLISAVAATPAEAVSVDQLQRKVNQLERKRDRLATLVDRARRTIKRLESDKAELSSSVATLQTQRDQALAGLPAAIAAIPNDQIWPLVLTPMRQRSWPCDDFYNAGTYWSVDFWASTSGC